MKKFLKCKNGNIIFATGYNNLDEIYHGINLASPQLKQVNIPLSNIKTGWHVDLEEAEVMVKKSVDVSLVYAKYPETSLQKQLKKVIKGLSLLELAATN